MGLKLGIPGLTAHRFRHSFAVALLNYGIRESALQKLMGHATLGMTLEYARILDQTVEQAFTTAVEQMQEGPHSWVPNFFVQEEYTLFVEGDAVSWIRLPLGLSRREFPFESCSVARNYWPSAAHTCTVSSKLAEAMRFPSGDHATPY